MAETVREREHSDHFIHDEINRRIGGMFDTAKDTDPLHLMHPPSIPSETRVPNGIQPSKEMRTQLNVWPKATTFPALPRRGA